MHANQNASSAPVPPAVAPAPQAPARTRQPRWLHPVLAVLLVVVAFLLATIIAELLVSIYPSARHWTAGQAREWVTNNTVAQFVFGILAYGLLVLPIVLVMRRRGYRLADVGIKRPRWRDPGYALLALPLYFISYGLLVGAVTQLVPHLNVGQKQQIGFGNATGPTDLILTFISLAIIPPVAEEFVMRGFLFSTLRARTRLITAVLVTSVVFAAGHLQFGSGAPLLWIAAIDTFVLSLVLIFLRVQTGSLWASIMLHMLKNTIAFVTIFILHKG